MKKIKTNRNIYKIIKGYSIDTRNASLNEASQQRLEEACTILKELNIHTLPELLVDARLQKVEYRWYHTGFRTRSLWKNIYMTVNNSVGEEVHFVQNHEFGSDHYNIYKIKSLQR